MPAAWSAEIARGQVYSVVELPFRGPMQKAADAPARDIELWARIRHSSGSPEYKVFGYWDGEDRFRIRFSPTKAGAWRIEEVHSNASQLAGQHKGDTIAATASSLHGFWEVDEASPGRRWFKRSDGSHQFIYGNTHYSFLSQMRWDGKPTGSSVEKDVRGNAEFFKKLRFSPIGDLYPDPAVAPFLDGEGKPTYSGAWSHKPNPEWFSKRADSTLR